MARSFLTGITTGAIIGAAVSMMLVPEIDKNTRRKIKRFDRMVMSAAGGAYNSMRRLAR